MSHHVRSDGVEYVLATLEFGGGRGFCNEAAVIRRSTGTLIGTVPTWMTRTLAGVVQDIDQDGSHELVLRKLIAPYEGMMSCRATVPMVYKCNTQSCADATEQSTSVLSNALVENAAALEGLLNSADPYAPELRACLTMSAAHLKRASGIDRRAGLSEALEWLQSPDAKTRRRAVAMLGDIDDPVAATALSAMAKDSDSTVADFARHTVAAAQQRRSGTVPQR